MPPELETNVEAPVVDNARDDVREAIASLKENSNSSASAPPSQNAADDSADVSARPGTEGRPRDEHGRFSPKVEAAEPATPPAPVSDADPAQANLVQPSPAVEAPKSWSAEAKAEFGKLTPAVQAAVIKRESEIDQGGQRWSEEKKALLGHFEPVRAASEKHRVHPAEVIKRLADANDYLERDPPAAIAWLAKSYGVDLSQLAANPPTPQPQADPRLAELQSEVSTFKQYVQTQQAEQVNSTISSFATQPGHEHFEAVKQDMGYLMIASQQAGRDLSMQDAYDQAVWANPTTRATMLAAQTATASQRATAERAKRGAISLNGAPSGSMAAAPPRSDPNATVKDDVRAALAQLRH